jgi:hypothetical protein
MTDLPIGRSPIDMRSFAMHSFDIEVILRESDRAVTERASHRVSPSDWTENDVRDVLKAILSAIDRVKNPGVPLREVTLRGFSWIVEPSEDEVVIAVEIPTGAAVAGPFDIPRARLAEMIERVVATAATTFIH